MEPMTLNRKIFCAMSSLLNIKFIVQKQKRGRTWKGNSAKFHPRKTFIEYNYLHVYNNNIYFLPAKHSRLV